MKPCQELRWFILKPMTNPLDGFVNDALAFAPRRWSFAEYDVALAKELFGIDPLGFEDRAVGALVKKFIVGTTAFPSTKAKETIQFVYFFGDSEKHVVVLLQFQRTVMNRFWIHGLIAPLFPCP